MSPISAISSAAVTVLIPSIDCNLKWVSPNLTKLFFRLLNQFSATLHILHHIDYKEVS